MRLAPRDPGGPVAPSAAAITLAAVRALVEGVWQVPEPQARRLQQALRCAPCARARRLRQQFALLGTTDIDALFLQTLTPRFIVDLLNDLRAVGILTPHDVHRIEEAVLRCVDKDGNWLNYDAYTQGDSHGV